MRKFNFIRNHAGDMGIGAMIVFIAMVLVAGIAASVLVQTANKLEIRAMVTGQQTTKEVSTGLRVSDINGYVVGGKIGKLAIIVQARAGSSDIDLSQTVIEITDGTTKTLLKFNTSKAWNFNTTVWTNADLFSTGAWNETNSEFGIVVLADPDGSMSSQTTPHINSGDVVCLSISATNCFSGLDPRDNVWGKVMPEVGSPGIFSFRVPASLSLSIYDLY